MPLGTLERDAPSFFKQGSSALTKLVFFSALALFLMVADTRFRITQPLRSAVSAVLQPVQWLALQPVHWGRAANDYLETRDTAQQVESDARRKLALQSLKANQVDELLLENERLRKLLELRERVQTPARAAEVLYDAADPYTRKVILDQGLTHGIAPGSPVIDESGVLGQVTRVHPFLSEVTLLVDRDQTIPVLNVRTGVRSVAYGDPLSALGGGVELRFTPAGADVQEGDLLTTSGVDGVSPPGLPVARVDKVERRVDSAFARIHGVPLALTQGARHVMVLTPGAAAVPPRPEPVAAPASKKAGRK